MQISPVLQFIMVALFFVAGFMAIFGPLLWLWLSLVVGFILGLVTGVVQSGFPQGLLAGAVYGLFLDALLLISGGVTRYFQRSGFRLWRDFFKGKKD